MAQYREYQGLPVQQAGCTYSQLKYTYGVPSAASSLSSACNSNSSNMAYSLGAVKTPVMSNYVVPLMCPGGQGPNYPPRYDTLSHGQPYVCGGHFTITGAYPYADCTNCGLQFVNRPCSGNIMGQCSKSK